MEKTTSIELKKLPEVYSSDAIAEAAEKYDFQENLTGELDAYTGEFTQLQLLKIMLWKLNRYPGDLGELIVQLNDLKKDYTESKARTVLEKMLGIKGFDLPMASTILRFALPNIFQIIDQRVYRFITPQATRLKLSLNVQRKIELYFEYLGHLRCVCRQYNIPFENADRILYQLDKTVNKEVKIHGYSK